MLEPAIGKVKYVRLGRNFFRADKPRPSNPDAGSYCIRVDSRTFYLGPKSQMTEEDARKEAFHYLHLIRMGVDPWDERKKDQEAKRLLKQKPVNAKLVNVPLRTRDDFKSDKSWREYVRNMRYKEQENHPALLARKRTKIRCRRKNQIDLRVFRALLKRFPDEMRSLIVTMEEESGTSVKE